MMVFSVKSESNFQLYDMLIFIKTVFSWINYKQENEGFRTKIVASFEKNPGLSLSSANLLRGRPRVSS